jgi:hypothetical protein
MNGRDEFVLKRGGGMVCFLQAKKDDLDQGVAPNLLGAEATCIADIENAHMNDDLWTCWYIRLCGLGFHHSFDTKINMSL